MLGEGVFGQSHGTQLHSPAAALGSIDGASPSPPPGLHIPLRTTWKHASEEKKNFNAGGGGEGKERNVSGGIIGTGAGF